MKKKWSWFFRYASAAVLTVIMFYFVSLFSFYVTGIQSFALKYLIVIFLTLITYIVFRIALTKLKVI